MRKRTILIIFIIIVAALYFLKDVPPFNQFLAVGGAVSITGYLKQAYDKITTSLQENSLAQTGLTTGIISGTVGLLVRRLGNIKLRKETTRITNEVGNELYNEFLGLKNTVSTEVVQLTNRVGILEQELTQKTQLLTDATRDWDIEKTSLTTTVDSLKRQNNELHAIINALKKPPPTPKID